MNFRNRIVIVGCMSLGALPAALYAQNAQQAPPEVRYLSVTRFQAPQGSEDREKVMMWIDSVMVPQARLNPNVLSSHVATHNWGANSNEIVLISEYPSWAAIEAECAACDRWSEQNQPKPGTPEAKKWEEIGRVFGQYYGGHSDEIYAIPVNRSKSR